MDSSKWASGERLWRRFSLGDADAGSTANELMEAVAESGVVARASSRPRA